MLLLAGCGQDDDDTSSDLQEPTAVVAVTGASASPRRITVSGETTLRFESGDGEAHALLIAVGDGYRAEVKAAGITEMEVDLPRGSYPFVIDDQQRPDTFVLEVSDNDNPSMSVGDAAPATTGE